MSYFIKNICKDVPIGSIYAYTGITDPDGWVICNGQLRTVSDNRYQALLNLGIGSGSANSYTPPDLRYYILRGKTDSETLGTTKGSDTFTITAANLPAHSHSYSCNGTLPAHTHYFDAHTHDIKHTHDATLYCNYDDHNFNGGSRQAIHDRSYDGSTTFNTFNHVQVIVENQTLDTGWASTASNTVSAGSMSINMTTTNSGSATTVNNIPNSFRVNYILKV